MPILPPEPDCLPHDLWEQADLDQRQWWLMYTHSRQEKSLMRELIKEDIWHYGPLIPQRKRSPAGRIRTSYLPLFTNYVFVTGDDDARYRAVCTGHIMKATEIQETEDLVADLRQIRSLIDTGVPLTVESRLEAGETIRVRNGHFKGYEGTVIRREGETRLLVSVRFMEQGVSVALEDCQVEAV